ncbi:MAG: acetolactate synthase large subunit [Chloroflexota bacterium]|nr:acetolactate synthase large subunit [Chloroflexota bacterium]
MATKPRTTADLLVACLENEGVRYIFGVPGEENLNLMEALAESESIRFVTTRHEGGAAFMADLYGRLSTYPGVCLATLGPGATNLLTGVADAQLDRAPLVAITGQAGLDRMHKESHQYIDVVQMFRPVTKWNARVEQPENTPEIVRKAFRLARLEKPGATHIELPEDVAAESVGDDAAPMAVRRTTYPRADPKSLARAAELLRSATRPVILAGNGVIRRRATAALRALANELGIGVTSTFMAKGVMDYRNPLAEPAVGLRALEASQFGLTDADVVIVVGYDLVEWSPELWNRARDKTIIHVDSTPAEIDLYYLPAIEVVGEIADSLDALRAAMVGHQGAWPAPRIGSDEEEELRGFASDDSMPMKPQRVISALRDALGDDDILISDVGAHKLWLARLYPTAQPNTCIIANGFAAMGIALPGAIAAKLVFPNRKVIAVNGDGGFLMNAQELETARRMKTAFPTVVWKDGRYGVIELNQTRRFGRTFGIEFGNPDFVQFAQSFGLPAFRVEAAADLLPILKRALDLDQPSLIEVPVDYRENLHLAERLGVQ